MHFVKNNDLQSWIVLLCFFHIRTCIAKHVELQNVVGTLMDQSQDHELGSFIVQNRLKGVELGG
jgi:hypothetical protein